MAITHHLKALRLAVVMAPLLGFAAGAANAESLREALVSAYTNNPNMASALLSVQSASEGIALAKSGKNPVIGGALSNTSSYSNMGGTQSTSNTTTLGLTYSQTLFDNLKTDAQIEQARAMSEVAAQALRNAEQNVLLSAARAYMEVIRTTQLVQLRQDNVSFLQAQVQSARDRLDVGEGTRIDVAQAEAQYAQAVASYKTAVNDLQTARATYERWVGHKPSGLSGDFNFNGMLPGSIDEATRIAEAQHPAILSARAQLRAAQSASDAAKSAFGPTLDLIGTLCAIQCFGATAPGGVSGSVKLTLSIPIYAGGALGASVRQANLNQVKSEVDALAARDQVREAVISAWSGLQTAISSIESAQTSVSSAQLALEGVIEAQNVGQQTTLDVLNARATLTSIQEGLISARSARVVASFSLASAIGRLSAGDLGLPVQIKSADGYQRKVEDIWSELRAVPQ